MRYDDSDDDYQTKEGTAQEGTYAIRRTEEYSIPTRTKNQSTSP